MSNDHNSQEILVCCQVENNNAEAGGVAGEEPGEEGGAGRPRHSVSLLQALVPRAPHTHPEPCQVGPHVELRHLPTLLAPRPNTSQVLNEVTSEMMT